MSTSCPESWRVLAALAPRLSVPVVVVQHMSDEFVEGFVHWLGVSVACPVVKATNMARLAPGVVHVAPGDQHLTVDAQLVTHLDLTAPLNSCRPSADRLFASLASSFGPAASGVLLTGMGRDGATGLLSMRQAGAVTIAQDETSSVVFGMPGEAIRMGGATVTLPLDRIAPALRELLPAAREVP
ncbi:MAG: chemotaxis protein CheB [Candidatus Riflebacteria bacterium]|nr:chemotaxis protein CheB [Candidatus Riflebacteria bacterium]